MFVLQSRRYSSSGTSSEMGVQEQQRRGVYGKEEISIVLESGMNAVVIRFGDHK